MKRKKSNFNKHGFSLIEVLCAIVLLALVATPVIQIIYSSLSMNVQSKKMLAAADLTSDIMESVSSLAFEDFSYTKVGDTSPTTVYGAKRNYWADTEGALAIHAGGANYKVYPGGPTGTFSSYYKTTDKRILTLDNVDYNGYKFRVIITIDCVGSVVTNKYFTYNFSVDVYDNVDTDYYYSGAKTCIPNKF